MYLFKQFYNFFLYRLNKFPSYILDSIILQFFILIAALPLFAFWSIPVSFMGFIGNIIFYPFLFLFILVSLLIYCFEIFYLPNIFLINLLEKLNKFFIFLVSKGSENWVINLNKSYMYIFILFSIIALIILHLKKLNLHYKKILCFVFMFSLIFCNFHRNDEIINLDKKLICINFNKKSILIDSGGLLKSETILKLKQLGISKLDYLIILNPSTNILKSILSIINNFSVCYLLLPNWTGNFTNLGWGAWADILALAKRRSIKISAIDFFDQRIDFSTNSYLNIKIFDENVFKNNLNYKKISINYFIDDKKQLEIYNT